MPCTRKRIPLRSISAGDDHVKRTKWENSLALNMRQYKKVKQNEHIQS